ncbi:hypothetical protein AAAC51_36040 [Priestia megaterium]
MRTKTLLTAIVLLCITVFSAACGTQEKASTTSEKKEIEKFALQIGVSQLQNKQIYWWMRKRIFQR